MCFFVEQTNDPFTKQLLRVTALQITLMILCIEEHAFMFDHLDDIVKLYNYMSNKEEKAKWCFVSNIHQLSFCANFVFQYKIGLNIHVL